MQSVTPIDRLLAQEGWTPVAAPKQTVRPDAPCRVHVSKTRKGAFVITLSIAAGLVKELGAPARVHVRQNRAEQALVIEAGTDGFAPFALSTYAKTERRTIRLPAFTGMTVETVPEAAEAKVIAWKGSPALVVRLPAHLFIPGLRAPARAGS